MLAPSASCSKCYKGAIVSDNNQLRTGILSSGKRWRLIRSRKSCLIGPDGIEHGQHLVLTLDDDIVDCTTEEKAELYILAEEIAEALSVGNTANRYFIRKNGTGIVRNHTVHFHIVLPAIDVNPNADVDNPQFVLLRGVDSQVLAT